MSDTDALEPTTAKSSDSAGMPEAPAQPKAPIPSPAMMAKRHGAPAGSAYGRVDGNGIVYVTTADGEREVGSYPGASPQAALAYFARKYDDLKAQVDLLLHRVQATDMSAKDATESLTKIKAQVEDAHVVGDLAALDAAVAAIDAAVAEKREADKAARAVARAEATTARTAIVEEVEAIAHQVVERIQWKQSGARMRELLDQWKEAQRTGARLDKETEQSLWHRLSAARNSFDRSRRAHFAQLDATQGEAKSTKERLVADAERLATSRDWVATAGEFKRLMEQWRQAGRAGRSDDDALWERFRAAQDAFFAAKDAVVAVEEEEFRGNLAVKEALLAEADALLPIRDVEAAKSALRTIQDKWDKAGKVPRADLERIEKGMRRVEQAVRDADERKWTTSNPEAAARARSMVDQLEAAVAGLEADLRKAEASGNTRKVAEAQAALETRRQWLAQARAGLEEFGGR